MNDPDLRELETRIIQLEGSIKSHGERMGHVEGEVARVNGMLIGNGSEGMRSQVNSLTQAMKRNDSDHNEMKVLMQTMDRKISGRPSWPVALLLSGMLAIITGLVIHFVGG